MTKNKMFNLFKVLPFCFLLVSCGFQNSITNNNNPDSNIDEGGDSSQIVTVSGVTLNKTSLKLVVNQTYQLVATISPSNATNKNVSYLSSASDVVSINNGLLTAKKPGEALITVTTEDGHKTATCNVTVEGLEENENDEVIDLNIGEDLIDEEFVIISDDDSTISKENNIYTISTSTPLIYSLSGKLNGQIIIDSTARVELDLNNVSITSNTNSPIYVKNSDDVEIKSNKGTTNFIHDTRSAYTSDVEGQGKGSIYSENGDLKFTGKGNLKIEAGYYNAIHTKDDFSLKNTNIEIDAVHNGIKANDGIEIESGALDIKSGNDALVTENTGESSSLKQRGDISITSGSILINSIGDGLSAAQDVKISGNPVFEIKTDKFSSYDGETVEGDNDKAAKWYIRVPSSLYNTSYRYAAYINEEWTNFTYKESQNNGRTRYYIYEGLHNVDASSFTLYRFNSSSSNSLTTYNAKSDSKAFSSYGDMISISSISGNKISFGQWSNYTSGGNQGGMGGGNEGNNDRADHSAKGIKANNEIHIDGGKIAITSYDDAIHTNCDDIMFENNKYPTGNLYITGGNIILSASDDAIHSDTNLYISGGSILINESYEGIEANTINIEGGDITLFAKDDGVNACYGKLEPSITISGGKIDETVSPNGDTDGIDSNGTYTQTGGIVIARGPYGANSAALDTDGSVTISGGTLVLLGSIEKTPILTNITTTTGLSGHSTGNHTISIGELTFTYNNKYSYSRTTVYSSYGKAVMA